MYLKKTPNKKGRISLSAVQGYRDNGRVRQRTIETFGYVDELQAIYPDPITHFTQVVKEMDNKRLTSEGPQKLEIHPRQKVDMREENRKYVGDAVPFAYYNALGIEHAIRSHMRGRKVVFDVNALLRLLVIERLVLPGSKHAAWERAGKHFFKADFSESNLYRGLDEFARMSQAIVSKMNNSIATSGIRDLTCGYYDCTNYYFESDGDEFRKKGVSKEHRPNPIVQMGLMQDAHGIPVDFHIFAGNTNDSQTLIDALPEAKKAAGMKRVVTVADKGMNSSANIIATVARKDGFVFSQSIHGTKSDRSLREWVLSDKDYNVTENGEFKMKSKQSVKKVTVSKELSHDGRAHAIDVDIQVVAFWSRKYAERARHERENVLEKSRQLIHCPSKYTRATHLGAAKYVRNITFDKNSGEVIECEATPELDYDAIKADAACDGYYCIITSETNWSPQKVVNTYQELWRIEESFKVTKSWLKARPVYVWTKAHIQAHFLICYIALVIERIIEHALGQKYSAEAILEEIKAIQCSRAEGEWWLFDHRSKLTEKLFALIEEESPRKWMCYSEIKDLFKKNKKICW